MGRFAAAAKDGMAKQATAQLSQFARSVEQARTLHRNGRLDEADQIYDAILAADPHHFDALQLSGVLKHQQGRSVEALRLVAAALEAQPGSADAQMNYGVILAALDRHEEALASFDRLLAMGAGDDSTLHYNRGNVLDNIGRHAEAVASYDAALTFAPNHTDALYNRGNALRSLGRIEDALASYDEALSLAPDRADIRTNRSALLLMLERIDEALEGLDKVLAEDPDDIAALNNRGNALTRLKRYDEALTSYGRALTLCPDHADALSNRGLALTELGRYDEALADFAQALRIAPDFVDAHLNRGNTLIKLARMEEALRGYSAALALSPQHAEANFNAALTRLCLGDFRQGWKQYEYRWERKKFAVQRPNFPRPMWRGEEGLRGKTILLTAEQGLGDAIQFVRYAPLAAARGAKVLLGVHRPLAALMASVPGVSQVIADGDMLPDFDLYCPLMSLPFAFETEMATIPADVPYIWPQEERIAEWRARMPQNGRLRAGICWAGGSAYDNDRNRSISLDRFAAILSVPDIDFVSLQKDVSEADAAILRRHDVVQFGRQFSDFSDTAAAVAMLDLVIAVDTSVAHLAGAMGKAVGVLVPFAPDFRWMLDRTDTPWYPTMRLFRQSAIGDWDAPLERVRHELTDLARQPRAR
jgi:tetratricopeptide (TPR) repeat protein